MIKEKCIFAVIAKGFFGKCSLIFLIFPRFNKPPYINCERESKELLSICLNRIKELNQVKLSDAAFIWTEPHSRRISLRLTVQKEVGLLQISKSLSFIKGESKHFYTKIC